MEVVQLQRCQSTDAKLLDFSLVDGQKKGLCFSIGQLPRTNITNQRVKIVKRQIDLNILEFNGATSNSMSRSMSSCHPIVIV